ncbi:MAG: hypothetical protein ACAH80_09790 [Alphaproteobacteria bacterium]
MKDYEETLYYSESQRKLMKGNAGVVLLEGSDKPYLSTETKTNLCLRDPFDRGMREEEGAALLKSAWKDAVPFYSGFGSGYKRLLNGANEVTQYGKDWCDAHGVEPSPDALRAAAEAPPARLRVLKPFQLRGK